MNEPQHAGEFLKGILKQAGVDKWRAAFENALDRIMSEAQRPHCQVMGFRNGKLTIEVDSAPLYSELSGFRREEIRLAINELVPTRQVAQLQFRLGGTGRA